MSMSDPIADLLTRIRNGLMAKFRTVDIPASRIKEEICNVLKSEGYIVDYSVERDTAQGTLRIELKYTPENTPVIQGIQRVSRPSLRRHVKSKEIPLVRSGLGIAIISTSQGVMTGKQARNDKVGGEVLCEVW